MKKNFLTIESFVCNKYDATGIRVIAWRLCTNLSNYGEKTSYLQPAAATRIL